MSTVFSLSERAHPNEVAKLLEKSRGTLDDPSRFAVVSTKAGMVVLAGADAPAKPGRVDVMASPPGSSEQQRVTGQVYVVAKANLFTLPGKLSIAAATACESGALIALLGGNWKAGLVLLAAGAWAAVPAACGYIEQVKTAIHARRALRAEGIDLAKVNPEPESGFAEILARSSVPY